MKNSIIVFFGLLILLSISKTFSQGIMYSYDLNGNRKLRDVIVLTQNKSFAPPDSTNNNNAPTLAQITTSYSDNYTKEQIEAIVAGNKVLIYPNPAKYYITVEIENISAQKAEINVCDVFGKLIENIQVTDNRTLIDFSQKAIGTYLLKITIAHKSDIWKIIKN
ncbi:MAG TPA: T9SS type A sorting domain-containing protein [Bacteroidales bacterium]|nr:T9SS type A sorting domain-containing protein [Bacteroidales bacterium]